MYPLHILFILSLATISYSEECTSSLIFFNPATGDDFLTFETPTNVSISSLTGSFDIRAEFCSDGIQSVVFVISEDSNRRVANSNPYTSGPVSVGNLARIQAVVFDGLPAFVTAMALDDFKGDGNVVESFRLDFVATGKTPPTTVPATSTPSPSPSASLVSIADSSPSPSPSPSSSSLPSSLPSPSPSSSSLPSPSPSSSSLPSPSSPPSSSPSPSPTSDPSISLLSFSATTFNAPNTDPLVFQVSGDAFDPNIDNRTVLAVNQVRIPNSVISVTGTRLTADTELLAGQNNITLEVPSAEGGGLVTFFTVIWVGTESLTVNIVQFDGTPFLVQSSVTATLADNSSVQAVADTNSGSVTFDNLPLRTILLEAVSENNDVGTAATISSDDSISIVINGFSEPSSIDNNDFSSGLAGWVILNPNVASVVDHVEEVGPQARVALGKQEAVSPGDPEVLESRAGRQLTNMDLQLDTQDEGIQSVFRTFVPIFGTTGVRVRYRFITSEIPGGFFGSEFNDFFTVSIRSRVEGGNIMETASMNGLGLAAFNQETGSTAWREEVLPLNEDFDTVEVRISVANVGDGEFDSSVIVDFVEELGCNLGEELEAGFAVGPFDAFTASRLAGEAFEVSGTTGLPGAHNGELDAFRHCFWNCRMAQEIGADQARMVGDLHELCGNNPEAERVMDLNNNAVGRGFGSAGANCRALCLQGVSNGALQTSLQ